MKTVLITLIFNFFLFNAFSQFTYKGNDGMNCWGSLKDKYTYLNFKSGTHGAGYTIYKNGTAIRSNVNDRGRCDVMNITFINDSVGFFVENWEGIQRIYKTINYGTDWVYFGYHNIIYVDMYIVNSKVIYLIGTHYRIPYDINIIKITENVHYGKYLLYSDSINKTIKEHNVLDTIVGEPLCPNMSHINFNIEGNGTTYQVAINFNKILTSTSSDKLNNLEVVTYPNPATDYLYWNNINGDNLNSEISVYNQVGQRVKYFNSKQSSMNVSELNSGIYLLEVICNKNRYVKKFIKK